MSDFKKKGMLFSRMWLPTKLTIEAEHLGNDKWQIKYAETLPEDIPPEDFKLTVETAKQLGVKVETEANTLRYTMTGTRNHVFSLILGESLAVSDIGDLTLRELLAIATMGLPTLMKKAKEKGRKAKP